WSWPRASSAAVYGGSQITTSAAPINHRPHPAGSRAASSPTGTGRSRNEYDQLTGDMSTIPAAAAANPRSRASTGSRRRAAHTVSPATASCDTRASTTPSTGASATAVTLWSGVGANSRIQNPVADTFIHDEAFAAAVAGTTSRA